MAQRMKTLFSGKKKSPKTKYVNPKSAKTLKLVEPLDYWDFVDRVMKEVFLIKDAESYRKRKSLQEAIESRPISEQILFFHTNPLNLIMDLTDIEPNQSQLNHYQNMFSQWH